ncbi:MAG: hypothetical protein KDA96_27770, partial [Planctomycetaceae bacterium]|nr:hypothetical protein [Planctomycetaceae bacterium]
GQRQVLLFDDADLAFDDAVQLLRFVNSVAQQSDGMLSVIHVSRSVLVPGLGSNSGLRVALMPLSHDESAEFVSRWLIVNGFASGNVQRSAIEAIAVLASGNVSRLLQFCELLAIVQQTAPETLIDETTVQSVERELMSRVAA